MIHRAFDGITPALPRYLWPIAQACVGPRVRVAGAVIRVPGTLPIRVSVVAGNIRMHRLFDRAIRRGMTIIDVGANIGYNTVYAAGLTGSKGRVIAVEPASDNTQMLRENIAANGIENVTVHQLAAGRAREKRDLFLRGDVSAVNSLFPESVYATVTGVEPVEIVPLDDLVDGDADLVKIDVEGAELDVLGGMTRMLRRSAIQLIVEWHPRLQEAAGYAGDALPRFLLENRFALQAASHTSVVALPAADIDTFCARLRHTGRPVELVAVHAGP
jgi:FkbM family methyltransferase